MEETYISGELAAHLLGVSRGTLRRYKMLEPHYRTEEHSGTGQLRPVVRHAASELVKRAETRVSNPQTVKLLWSEPHNAVHVDRLHWAAQSLSHANLCVETLRAEVEQEKARADLANEALGDIQARVSHLQKVCNQKSDYAANQAAKLMRLEEALRISEGRAAEALRQEAEARLSMRVFAAIAVIQAVGALIGMLVWA